MAPIDEAALKFSPESLVILNLALGFLVFSVSLFIDARDFRVLRDRPLGVVTGLVSQWLLLPGLTLGLVLALEPHPGLALGMLLVAACPGGNVSNYLCLMARANLVLSIGLTSLSTLAAAVLTPLVFVAGSHLAAGGLDLPQLQVPFWPMLQSVLTIIAIPLALGLLLKARWPAIALRIRGPLRFMAGGVLLAFIVLALLNNLGAFRDHVGNVAGLVIAHNALALAAGFGLAAAAGLPTPDRRTISIETGIQNSGLALVLIFNFFDGDGAMALVAAGWGLWHIVSGGCLALYWSRQPGKTSPLTEPT